MDTQTASTRPALRLVVTDVPRLSARKEGVQVATVGGEVVDPFGLSVTTLVGTLKKRARSHSGRTSRRRARMFSSRFLPAAIPIRLQLRSRR